jgi:hypothetical protein
MVVSPGTQPNGRPMNSKELGESGPSQDGSASVRNFEVNGYALDELCGVIRVLAAGPLEFIHLRRLHPYSSGDDTCCGGYPADSKSERFRTGQAKIRRSIPVTRTKRTQPRWSENLMNLGRGVNAFGQSCVLVAWMHAMRSRHGGERDHSIETGAAVPQRKKARPSWYWPDSHRPR